MWVNKKYAESSGARECHLGLRIAIFNNSQTSRSGNKIYGYFWTRGRISASGKVGDWYGQKEGGRIVGVEIKEERISKVIAES